MRRARRQRMTAVATAAAFVALSLLWEAPIAHAGFGDPVGASHTISTNTLQPPTNPSLARGTCSAFVSDQIKVNWTATTSTWADGQEVLRSTTSGGPYTVVGTVGPTATTFTNTGLPFNTTYHYVVRASRNLWRSANTVQVSMTTRSSACL